MISRTIRAALPAAAVLAVAACGDPVSPEPGADPEATRAFLLERNREILEAYVVANDTAPLDAAAVDDYFVVTPIGMESRSHVLATVGNLDVTELRIEGPEVRLHGDTAILTGTLHGDGTLSGRPFPAMTHVTVFVRDGDDWRLAARSLTPLFTAPPGASGGPGSHAAPPDQPPEPGSPAMPTDRKIDYVELPAIDFDAVQAFYEAVFGWSFTDYGPEYRSFTDGKLNGGFYRSDLQSRTDQGAALVVFFADDLEATRDAVVANGGRMEKDIFEFPGGRRFQFLDPHGNELAVWSDR